MPTQRQRTHPTMPPGQRTTVCSSKPYGELTPEPDTGIVNFYQLNDTLMAHVDRSELDNSRPLVSIS
jgi:alkylated DNA repair protein alkB family protein 1